jgi:hypothetical protein
MYVFVKLFEKSKFYASMKGGEIEEYKYFSNELRDALRERKRIVIGEQNQHFNETYGVVDFNDDLKALIHPLNSGVKIKSEMCLFTHGVMHVLADTNVYGKDAYDNSTQRVKMLKKVYNLEVLKPNKSLKDVSSGEWNKKFLSSYHYTSLQCYKSSNFIDRNLITEKFTVLFERFGRMSKTQYTGKIMYPYGIEGLSNDKLRAVVCPPKNGDGDPLIYMFTSEPFHVTTDSYILGSDFFSTQELYENLYKNILNVLKTIPLKEDAFREEEHKLYCDIFKNYKEFKPSSETNKNVKIPLYAQETDEGESKLRKNLVYAPIFVPNEEPMIEYDFAHPEVNADPTSSFYKNIDKDYMKKFITNTNVNDPNNHTVPIQNTNNSETIIPISFQ